MNSKWLLTTLGLALFVTHWARGETLYEFIAVGKNADQGQILRACTALRDKYNHDGNAHGLLPLVDAAQRILSDPQRRKQYDHFLDAWTRSELVPFSTNEFERATALSLSTGNPVDDWINQLGEHLQSDVFNYWANFEVTDFGFPRVISHHDQSEIDEALPLASTLVGLNDRLSNDRTFSSIVPIASVAAGALLREQESPDVRRTGVAIFVEHSAEEILTELNAPIISSREAVDLAAAGFYALHPDTFYKILKNGLARLDGFFDFKQRAALVGLASLRSESETIGSHHNFENLLSIIYPELGLSKFDAEKPKKRISLLGMQMYSYGGIYPWDNWKEHELFEKYLIEILENQVKDGQPIGQVQLSDVERFKLGESVLRFFAAHPLRNSRRVIQAYKMGASPNVLNGALRPVTERLIRYELGVFHGSVPEITDTGIVYSRAYVNTDHRMPSVMYKMQNVLEKMKQQDKSGDQSLAKPGLMASCFNMFKSLTK